MPQPQYPDEVLSAREFLARKYSYEVLMEPDLLITGGRLLLGATWKAGKSYLALQMMAALTAGTPLFELFRVPRPVRVLYVDFDNLPYHQQARFEHLPLNDNSYIWFPQNLWLDTDDGMTRLRSKIEQCQAEVVIYDCYYKMVTFSENDEEKFKTQLVPKLDALANDCNIGQILIHHMRKPSTTAYGKPVKQRDTDIGGTRLLLAWAFSILSLTTDINNKSELEFAIRGEPVESLSLSRDSLSGFFYPTTNQPPHSTERVYTALQRMSQHTTSSVYQKHLQAETELPRRTFYYALAQLEQQGKISISKNGRERIIIPKLVKI